MKRCKLTDAIYRPVPQVIEKLTAQRPSPASCWRMINRGGRGGKLAAQLILGRWCCTPADFLDYVRRQSAATLEARSVAASRSAQSAETNSQLESIGLL